jgi:hypothetical protein
MSRFCTSHAPQVEYSSVTYLDHKLPRALCIYPDIALYAWWQLQQPPCPLPAPAAQVHCKGDLPSWHVAVTSHLAANQQQLLRLQLLLLMMVLVPLLLVCLLLLAP